MKEKLWVKSHTSRGEREIFLFKSWKSRRERDFFLQNLINREEKEKFFLKILKLEKRKRIWFSNSWKSRREREIQIQFSRPRVKQISHFSRLFSRDRDSCHRLPGSDVPLAMFFHRGKENAKELTQLHELFPIALNNSNTRDSLEYCVWSASAPVQN